MKLAQLFPAQVTPDLEISGMTMDSRRVRPGDLFLAVPGLQQDGRAYIDQAVASGAVAVA